MISNIEPADCLKCFSLNRRCVALIENNVLYAQNSSRKRSIVCFDSGTVLWVLDKVAESDFWQPSDSFVGLVDDFYIRSIDKGTRFQKYKKPGFVRGITFHGFSYEINIMSGDAVYFDFHK